MRSSIDGYWYFCRSKMHKKQVSFYVNVTFFLFSFLPAFLPDLSCLSFLHRGFKSCREKFFLVTIPLGVERSESSLF